VSGMKLFLIGLFLLLAILACRLLLVPSGDESPLTWQEYGLGSKTRCSSGVAPRLLTRFEIWPQGPYVEVWQEQQQRHLPPLLDAAASPVNESAAEQPDRPRTREPRR
jgi:hypothetical protein